ncbi:MAG: SUMF1/EgtB/PvdO family nonheme iron enzyme [Acidobacteria bacterium]|nr:SUMF1/EgtB/PvdO family nonheme iron enzyme [Acidobacteriota bacterium]
MKREIQDLLIDRTQDMKADLRARIAAGEALGIIGDPRFELRKGPFGEYLMPPMVEIPGEKYPMGLNNAPYDREEPEHKVELESFQIGKFPVTNAEYAKFIAADGYENEQWWDTPESLKWLREGGAEGTEQSWKDQRKILQENWTEEELRDLVRQNRATSEQVEDMLETRNWTDEEFEQWLDETFPPGKLYRQPEYWDDTRFYNPSQPVVGVTWFEARAYCNWLTANSHGVPPSGGTQSIFRLPTEAEFEVAARGKKGRMFHYGKEFEVGRSNTFESHIRRSTPVGIFQNATPEGAYDLSGNVYTWTLSIYDQEKFPYPYRADDGREDINATEVRRVLRGGSWDNSQDFARAVYRYNDNPLVRYYRLGFRVVGVVRPPSLRFFCTLSGAVREAQGRSPSPIFRRRRRGKKFFTNVA